jgi:hypothetical protein
LLQLASKQAGCRIAAKQASRQARAGKVVLSKLLSDHLSLSLSISGQLPAALRDIYPAAQEQQQQQQGFGLKTYNHTNKVPNL